MAEKHTFTNIEVLDLVRMALMKGCADGMTDPIIPESWIALEHQFEAGRKRGYEVGRREGYEEGLAAAGMAEAAAICVIDGVFRRL